MIQCIACKVFQVERAWELCRVGSCVHYLRTPGMTLVPELQTTNRVNDYFAGSKRPARSVCARVRPEVCVKPEVCVCESCVCV
jgi:hypothetical protein